MNFTIIIFFFRTFSMSNRKVFNTLQTSKNKSVKQNKYFHTIQYRVLKKGPSDFRDSAKLSELFLKKHSQNPHNIMECGFGHCCTLPRLREPSWTVIDNQMDPVRLILGDPWWKRALQGPSMVPIDKYILFKIDL